MEVLYVIVCIISIVVIVSVPLYLTTGIGKRFFHDRLGWHMPNNKRTFNGYNVCSECKYCGKEIMQDSQGNWF